MSIFEQQNRARSALLRPQSARKERLLPPRCEHTGEEAGGSR